MTEMTYHIVCQDMSDDPQITQKEGNRNEKEVPDGSADGNGRLCSVYHRDHPKFCVNLRCGVE